MDKVRNPFNPGAGSQPPLLVGRDAQIEAMTVAVQRLAIGRSERSMMLKGLRGVGKTVLLNEFGRIAEREGWIHAHLEATEDVRIANAVAALSRRVLLELSVGARAKERAAHALGVLRSFIKVHVPLGGDAGSLVIDLEARPGEADSGQLDGDLSGVFTAVGDTARAAGTGVFLTIDEIQYLGKAELSALIIGLHRVSQLSLPLLVAGAGLVSLLFLGWLVKRAPTPSGCSGTSTLILSGPAMRPRLSRFQLKRRARDGQQTPWSKSFVLPRATRTFFRSLASRPGTLHPVRVSRSKTWRTLQGSRSRTSTKGSSGRELTGPPMLSVTIFERWRRLEDPGPTGPETCPSIWAGEQPRPDRPGTVS